MRGQQSRAGWTMQDKVALRDGTGWAPWVVMTIVGTLGIPWSMRGPREGLSREGGNSTAFRMVRKEVRGSGEKMGGNRQNRRGGAEMPRCDLDPAANRRGSQWSVWIYFGVPHPLQWTLGLDGLCQRVLSPTLYHQMPGAAPCLSL